MPSSENSQAYGSSSTKARIEHQLRACGAYARSLIMGLLGQNVASTEIRLSLRLVREYSQQIKLYRWCFVNQRFERSHGMLKSGNERCNYSVMEIGPKTQITITDWVSVILLGCRSTQSTMSHLNFTAVVIWWDFVNSSKQTYARCLRMSVSKSLLFR